MYEEFILGVDGGNTKTDFFLFSTSGKCVAHLRTGTSSHERFANGYAETENLLKERILEVCSRGNIAVDDIRAAVFGLAGADTDSQHLKLYEITQRILKCKTLVCNDSILGVMATSPECVGVCCINGTGSSVGGINKDGKKIQIGGFGYLSSDAAGGGHAAFEVLRHAYSEKYREGDTTSLTEGVYKLFGAHKNVDLMEILDPDKFKMTKELELQLSKLLFEEANKGDMVAKNIVKDMSLNMAQNTVACVHKLCFSENVTIVLAGSLWSKSGYSKMQEIYEQYIKQHLDVNCEIVILNEPPAVGAVLGAYKLLRQEIPSQNFINKVYSQIKKI